MAHVIWFTGPSGSGKTTLAEGLREEFFERALTVELLDGDVVRDFFEGDLGYSREERIWNVKRIAFAAMLLAKNNIPVIVANIAPYYEVRNFLRRHLPNYIQVYVRASFEMLRRRDVKGHYLKAEEGSLTNMIGLDDRYDIPRRPDLVVDTDTEPVEASLEKVLALCRERGLLTGER